MIASCSSREAEPVWFSTGYIDDQGAVRVWRQDDQQRHITLITAVYNSYQNDNILTSTFEYAQGTLSRVNQKYNKSDTKLQARFDASGQITYMQLQRDGQNQALSDDEITLIHHESQRIIKLTDALIVGKVKLVQGVWQGGNVSTCSGMPVELSLDAEQRTKIERHADHLSIPLGLAWLQAPEGVQLLLVANEDFCAWESGLKDDRTTNGGYS